MTKIGRLDPNDSRTSIGVTYHSANIVILRLIVESKVPTKVT